MILSAPRWSGRPPAPPFAQRPRPHARAHQVSSWRASSPSIHRTRAGIRRSSRQSSPAHPLARSAHHHFCRAPEECPAPFDRHLSRGRLRWRLSVRFLRRPAHARLFQPENPRIEQRPQLTKPRVFCGRCPLSSSISASIIPSALARSSTDPIIVRILKGHPHNLAQRRLLRVKRMDISVFPHMANATAIHEVEISPSGELDALASHAASFHHESCNDGIVFRHKVWNCGFGIGDWRIGGLADWRIGGLADWRIGGLRIIGAFFQFPHRLQQASADSGYRKRAQIRDEIDSRAQAQSALPTALCHPELVEGSLISCVASKPTL